MWLAGMSNRSAKLTLAGARATLHKELIEVLRGTGPNVEGAAFEAAFIRYVKKLFVDVAEEAKAADVESCQEQLRDVLIPALTLRHRTGRKASNNDLR